MIIYVVRRGDTLNSIAAQYGVSAGLVAELNGIENAGGLVVGEALVIRIPQTVHTVQNGETLYGIAVNYGVSVNTLLRNNPNLLERTISSGDEIVIAYDDEKLGTIRINGYAYPFINTAVLRSVLPFLTSLTIFGYGFDEEGNLDEPDDEKIIAMAYEYSAIPVMLISAMRGGVFNTALASAVFRNPTAQKNLINNILNTMRTKGYRGLDIDFEFIEPDDAQVYLDFVRNVTERLNAEGFTVNVDLAPKISADQEGLLYEAHNYAQLGRIANTVLLMTYEWGYMYSEPMAVAPIASVRRVLDYAVTEIAPEKIYMGIPNYGYDWTLPYVSGTAATVVGNDEAVRIAASRGAVIQFDESTQTPYFNYYDDFKTEHEVWFEDARSIAAKLRLIAEYGFSGAGYWNVMRAFVQNWQVVSALFDIAKLI